MSNIIAGIIRGQLPYLEEHIEQKRAIYERYKTGLADLPVSMNPFEDMSIPTTTEAKAEKLNKFISPIQDDEIERFLGVQ